MFGSFREGFYSTLLNADTPCLRAFYAFKEASSIEQLKKIKTPTLFIHGAEDDFVPVEMVDERFETCACPEKERAL